MSAPTMTDPHQSLPVMLRGPGWTAGWYRRDEPTPNHELETYCGYVNDENGHHFVTYTHELCARAWVLGAVSMKPGVLTGDDI